MGDSHTLERWSPYALAVLQIATALIFILHGTQKLFGFPAPPESEMPPLFSLFGIGGILELVGGLLILVGFFTRPAAFVLAGEMAVAYWMFHAPQSMYPVLNGGDAPSSTASCSCSSCSLAQEHGALTRHGDERVRDGPGSGDPQPLGLAGVVGSNAGEQHFQPPSFTAK